MLGQLEAYTIHIDQRPTDTKGPYPHADLCIESADFGTEPAVFNGRIGRF